MALATSSDAREGLTCHVSRLYAVLGCPHLPILREIYIIRLEDELPDNLGFRGSKLLDELLKLNLWGCIQPQHEACAVGAGIMEALVRSFLLPAHRKIRHGHLAHHVTEPWRNFHSRSNRCLLNSPMQFGIHEEEKVANGALGIALVERPYLAIT